MNTTNTRHLPTLSRLAGLGLLILLALRSSSVAAEPVAERAKKTADFTMAYVMKVFTIVQASDCGGVAKKLTAFATDHSKDLEKINAEFAAADKDKAYGEALKAEITRAKAKLDGKKKPPCADLPEVGAVLRKVLPPAMFEKKLPPPPPGR
jgi:hypothetical protein